MKESEQIKFRQQAVDHVASLTRLDHMIRITSPYLWIMMSAIYILLIAVVIWGFFGSVPTSVQGQGILLADKGSGVYNAVAPQGDGRITSFAVVPGDTVKKGQVLAYLENPNLAGQIKVTQTYLDQLNSTYNSQLALAKQNIKQYQDNMTAQNQVLQDIITSESKSLSSIGDFLKIQQQSYQKGLDTMERLVGTLQQYYSSQQSIDNSRQRLTQNKIDEANFIDQWEQRLQDLQLRIKDEQYKLNNLQQQFVLGQTVTSPVDGVVTDLQEAVGSTLHEGDPVANIASTGKGADAIIYVTAKEGKRIQPGMSALVSPGTVKKEEYGSIRGDVLSVSRFPVSRKAMEAVLQNDNLVEMFSRQGAPIVVRVHLRQNANTYSGFNWTSSSGPQQTVTPGTMANVEITVDQQRPVALVIPAFKKWLGID